MPRPGNKQDLARASSTEFERLRALIESLPKGLLEEGFIPADGGWNVRDIVAHLHEWHRLFLEWVRKNIAGDNVPMLPAPYTFKDLPAFNATLWELCRSTPCATAWAQLEGSHAEVMNLVDSFADEELFTKKYFSWTGSTSLGAYCTSVTSSHYDWASKNIRKMAKQVDVSREG